MMAPAAEIGYQLSEWPRLVGCCLSNRMNGAVEAKGISNPVRLGESDIVFNPLPLSQEHR
jgi:hypothetical protein